MQRAASLRDLLNELLTIFRPIPNGPQTIRFYLPFHKSMKPIRTILLSTLCLSASALCGIAQDEPRPEPPSGEKNGDRPKQGFGNPEEFRQRMNDRLKSSLKMSDEEWTAIQPLIEKVQD